MQEVLGQHRYFVELQVHPEAAGAVVDIHPAQLRRILANLLDNADRHAHGVTAVQVGRTRNRAFVAVEDDGPGVPQDRREAIFTRFHARPAAAEDAGMHLGLALSRQHARTAGGDLLVEGRDGGGARFLLLLPSDRKHDRAQRLEQSPATTQRDTGLYEQQAQHATALQHSMLTPLPHLGRVELAARYRPAVAAAEVGGDWYDTFRLPDGTTALVIGDVAGHDLQTTVRMGQLRTLMRALAIDRGEPPGDLLRRLDRVAAHLEIADAATCIYALHNRTAEGPWQLRFANAGHPPPLLITTEAEARYLDTPRHGMLLGAGLDQPRTSEAVNLPAGSTLLLYTDGLIEQRGSTITEGMDQLLHLAADLALEPLDALCDALLSGLAAEPADDVCLLALRIPSSRRAV